MYVMPQLPRNLTHLQHLSEAKCPSVASGRSSRLPVTSPGRLNYRPQVRCRAGSVARARRPPGGGSVRAFGCPVFAMRFLGIVLRRRLGPKWPAGCREIPTIDDTEGSGCRSDHGQLLDGLRREPYDRAERGHNGESKIGRISVAAFLLPTSIVRRALPAHARQSLARSAFPGLRPETRLRGEQ